MSDHFKATGLPGVMLFALLPLLSCSEIEDAAVADVSASLAASVVNCVATSNQIITSGSSEAAFTASIILDDAEDEWCTFDSGASQMTGTTGETLTLSIAENTSENYRSAQIDIVFSDDSTVNLVMWQMPFSDNPEYQQAWAEQPGYVQNSDYIYKTYYTTLVSTNKYLIGGYRRNYSICFDTTNRVALWVAYPLHACYTKPNTGRTNAWGYDPNTQLPVISTSLQAYVASSYGSGDTRGHQCPSADRYNTDATNEMTFYATNMMPQDYDFNSGSWGTLESLIRTWAPTDISTIRYDTLFVVTGAYLTGETITDRLNNTVGRPEKCWKVLLKQRRNQNENRQIWEFSADELQSIGFIFSNDSEGANTSVYEAACTVKEVEELTGFTFFENLDPDVAEAVKSQQPDTSLWPTLAIN